MSWKKKTKWVVKLPDDEKNRGRAFGIYGSDFFPRTYYYKKDAQVCQKRAKAERIETVMEKVEE